MTPVHLFNLIAEYSIAACAGAYVAVAFVDLVIDKAIKSIRRWKRI